jgi:GMP synthase (glutamine-hydrolysing)
MELNPPGESLAIIDAGGQYTKVIDRRIRELNVHTTILPCTITPEDLKKYRAAIISARG